MRTATDPDPYPRPRPGLVAARELLGLSQEGAAELVGVSYSTWARWERGTQGLHPHSRTQIAKAFEVTLDEVARWVEGEGATPVMPWMSMGEDGYVSQDATIAACAELWRWDVEPARRPFLASLLFVPAYVNEWLLGQLDPATSATRARSGSGPSVGPEDVRRIREATQAFAQMDRQFGGGLVRPAVVDYLHHRVAPLLRGSYSDEVGGQLLTVAALLTELAGWQAFDIGKHGLAQQHYGQALRLARAGGDDLTAALVLKNMAQQCVDLGQPQWAIRLATAAHQAGARARVSPRVEAALLLMEARAIALRVSLAGTDRHLTQRVERLLGGAEQRMAAAGPGDDDPVWIVYLIPAEVAAQSGICWQMIGQHRRAADCARQAVHGFGDRYPRARQLNIVNTAEALAATGEIDGALDEARSAVPLANALSSQRSVEVIKRFDRRLDPYADERRVRDWREYLRARLHVVAS